MMLTVVALLALHACAPETPAIGSVGPHPPTDKDGRRPLNAPMMAAAPGGGPAGGPPGKPGAKPGGQSSAGPGNDALGLAFNNADSLCRTGDGAMHTLYVEDGALKHSRDGGAPTTLSKGPVSLVSIATDGRAVVLAAWAEGRPPSIKIAWSADDGKTWTPASTLSNTGTAPSLRVWRSGDDTLAAVAWHEGGGPREDTPSHVFGAIYSKGAWSKPTQIDHSTRSAAWASLGGYGDKTWAVWRDNRGSDAQRWYLYLSAFNGQSWDTERPLNIEGHDPSVCMTDNGRMHIGYHHKIDAFYTYSDDGGTTWATPRLLDKGLFVQAECKGDTVALVYERMVKEGSFMDPKNKGVGLYVSNDAGKTFEQIPVGKGETGMVRPSAVFTPEGLTVEWVDQSGDVPKLSTQKVSTHAK